MQAEARLAAIRSIRNAEMRLQAVQRMLEEGDLGEQLLSELNAVQDLLSGVVDEMLHCEALERLNALVNSPANLSQREAITQLSLIYALCLRTSMVHKKGNR